MEELLNFWKLLLETFDKDLIKEMAEDEDINLRHFSKAYLAGRTPEEIDGVFVDLVRIYMNVEVTDLPDVYELMQGFVKDNERIGRILDAFEENYY